MDHHRDNSCQTTNEWTGDSDNPHHPHPSHSSSALLPLVTFCSAVIKASPEAKLKVFLVPQTMKMLHLLILAALLFKASTSQITGSGSTTADYGGEAEYKCKLSNPTGVLQVTWQRLFKDQSIENLATYSNRFGQQVNEPYQERVIFTEASLSSTSIKVMNVTWEDESCYICSFNAYPDGSKRKQTCLTVQGISEVNTNANTLSSEDDLEDVEKVVFSCSATGKPAPTIEWTHSPDAILIDQPKTTVEANSDHTYTSSGNITLKLPPDWRGHVYCVLNKGMTGERQLKIPFYLPPETPPLNEKGKGLSSSGIALVICAVVFILTITVAAALKRKRLKINRGNLNV